MDLNQDASRNEDSNAYIHRGIQKSTVLGKKMQ